MTTEHNALLDPYIHEPKDVTIAKANTAYIADGAGSGDWLPVGTGTGWERLHSGAVNAGNQTTTITWDETDACEIFIAMSGLRTDRFSGTDAFTFRLGHTNGTVMADQTHHWSYLYNFNVDQATPWSAGAAANTGKLHEGILTKVDYYEATLHLIGVQDPNLGAAFKLDCLYGLGTGGLLTEWHQGICGSTNGAAPDFVGVIDTIELSVVIGNWVSGGDVRVYGLKNNG